MFFFFLSLFPFFSHACTFSGTALCLAFESGRCVKRFYGRSREKTKVPAVVRRLIAKVVWILLGCSTLEDRDVSLWIRFHKGKNN